MKQNQFSQMLDIMQHTEAGARLLLHSCCAPCSSACLERLHGHFRVSVLYYNPNIVDEAEYEKRKAEQIRFLRETGWADFLDCDHRPQDFLALAKGLEDEPERGKRCYLCYRQRMEETAKTAREGNFDFFTTTLSLSPYKNAAWINEIGFALEREYGVRFLPSDFKKQGGYPESIRLSAQYGLYRQNYCGCPYSKAETERKRAERDNEQ